MAPLQLVDNIKNTTYTWIYESEEHILPAYLFIDGDIIKKFGLASGTWGANKERFSTFKPTESQAVACRRAKRQASGIHFHLHRACRMSG